MTAPLQALFVYYKLPQAEHAQWLARVQAFADALRAQWPGLSLELMQRPEVNADGLETWMEIYRHPDGVGDALIAAIDAAARAHQLPPKRASEVFIALRS